MNERGINIMIDDNGNISCADCGIAITAEQQNNEQWKLGHLELHVVKSDNILNPENIPGKIESSEQPKPTEETQEVQEPGQSVVNHVVESSSQVLPQAKEGETVKPISEGKEPVENRQANGTFGPGNNANPGGRPKRDWTWKEVLEDIALEYVKKRDGTISKKTYRDMLGKRLFTLGIGGNVQAINSLMNRMDGMPQQDITSGGEKMKGPMLYSPTEDADK